MAEIDENLVTVIEVKNEGSITDSTLNKNISYRIPKSTENILYDILELVDDEEVQEILDDRKKSINLKWAIIYDVLAWLEREGKIDGKNVDITTMKDSIVSVSFQRRKGTSESKKSQSYIDLRDEAIKKIISKNPPVGGASRRGRY